MKENTKKKRTTGRGFGSIRARIITITSVILVVVILVTTILAATMMKKEIEEISRYDLTELADFTAGNIDDNIKAEQKYVDSLGRSALFAPNVSMADRRDYFVEQAKIHGYLRFYEIDPKGEATNYDANLTKFNVSHRNYFKRSMLGEDYTSDILVDTDTGANIIVISAPIVAKNGKVIGVLAAVKNFKAFSDMITQHRYQETGYAVMISDRHEFLAHPAEEFVGLNVGESTDPKFSSIKSFVRDRIFKEQRGAGTYDFDGVSKEAAYARLQTKDWAVLFTVNQSELFAAVRNLNIVLAISGILVGLISMAVVFYTGSRIGREFKNVANYINELSNLNLAYQPRNDYSKRREEVGIIYRGVASLNLSFRNLIERIGSVSETLQKTSEGLEDKSSNISVISEEIANTVSELAKGAMNQAEDTENGASRTADMAKIIENNQTLNEDLNRAIENIKNNANEGRDVLGQLVGLTEENETVSKEVAEVVRTTEINSQNISQASEMIASIADQTNLLALNAAIEAARAGDAGRGFGVVAEEIRKLAEDSTQSTKTIHESVERLIESAAVAVTKMQEMEEISGKQRTSADETETKFTDILNAIAGAENSVREVMESSTEIETKKEEIISILESLAAIAEENAASTEEVSASTEEQAAQLNEISAESQKLTEISSDLNEEVGKFQI